ncbi:MAG: cyclopropane-fatty-acyl-phospholipid synthase [Nanoarchaeota archaeon]|nr:cyclopropane-fatty-acyl-phospholipid synthase [Nanoarchaeota archaeon]
MSSKKNILKLLALADVKINGSRPWDIRVHNPKLYSRVLSKGNLGLGESYMDGWWDCEDISELIYKLLRGGLRDKVRNINMVISWLIASILNLQNKSKAFEVGEKHYDAGNDLYKLMLDKRMVYTCGYWKTAKTLDKSQEDKLDLVCKKIGLKKGQKVLDIGCGWGSFAKFAAQKYKAKVVGITISKEQVKLAKKNCKGLDIEIRLQDYRSVKEKFDHIISLGMFEHVGVKNYRNYFKMAKRCLKDNGLFLLHTIGRNSSVKSGDLWYHKYIFPNSMLPSVKQIATASEKLFVLEDWHSFGPDYDKTLMEWHKNFNKNWDKIKDKYDERFKRMWNYYLLISAGSFRARQTQLWQIVFSKNGVEGGYKSIR